MDGPYVYKTLVVVGGYVETNILQVNLCWRLGCFCFNLLFQLSCPATQSHDLMGGWAGE